MLRRGSLLGSLDEALSARLLVIAAPAGYGKTLLLEEWLAGLDDDVLTGWINVDEQDNDPPRFWLHLVEVLRRAGASIEERILAEYLCNHSSIDELIAAVVNTLADLDRHHVVVVDDFHTVVTPDVVGPFFRLIEALPPNTTMVVIGRTAPGWPLRRLRAGGEVRLVEVDHLAFTRDETASVLGTLASEAVLDDSEIDVVQDRTEGWPVAVSLAAHGLRGNGCPHRMIAEFDGNDGAVAEFLLEEVLSSLGPTLHRFLLDVSVLDGFCAGLAGAVVGRPAGHLIEELIAKHLFVVAIDERSEWFRLHQLTRDWLLADVQATDPARVQLLRRRAAEWYARQGRIGAAVDQLVAAGNYGTATALIEKVFDQMYLARDLDSAIQWLQRVPPCQLEQRPGAASLLARLLTERGWFDDARAWIDVATRGATTDREYLDVLRARIRLERAQGRETAVLAALAELDALVDTLPDRKVRDLAQKEQIRTLRTRSIAHEFLGKREQRWASLTELDRRRSELAEAPALTVDPLLARAHAEDGELQTASSHARLAITRARRDGLQPQFLTHAYLAIAQVEWCRSRLDQAEVALHYAGQVDDGTQVWIRTLRAVRAAEIVASLGRHDQVDDILESGWRGTAGARTPPASRFMIAGWGLAIAARHGRRDTAYSWLAELNRLDDHAAANPAFLWAEAELLNGNPRALIDRFGVDGSSLPAQPLPRLRCALALARALQTTGHDAEFVPVLEGLLTHAENHDLLQPLIESRNFIAQLGSTSVIDSSPRFLERLGAPTSQQDEPSSLGQVSEALTRREVDLIRLLPSRLTNQEIATELYVSVNTVKSHLRSIYRKLGVTSRDAAISRCRQLEILTDPERVTSSYDRFEYMAD